MILLIDNYDSFVFNLERYFKRLGQDTVVIRNDEITASEVSNLDPRAIVFSPGPCAPQQAGRSLEIAKQFAPRIPMLGVCLGHQILAESFGGRIVRADQPMHGRTSRIVHDQEGVFCGLPTPLEVCRYHSLIVDATRMPVCLEATAHTDDGVVMAIRHRELPIVGLQFHPEAILTRSGYQMLSNFLRRIGLPSPNIDDEWQTPPQPSRVEPITDGPVTF